MTNTLILAFAGSSMAVIIIIAMYRLPFLRLINLNLLGLEVIQGIAGSIGLILTVPITALCAAFFASAGNKKKQPVNSHAKGGRKKS
jgi:Predicted multitransmembrane protein